MQSISASVTVTQKVFKIFLDNDYYQLGRYL